MGFDLTQLYHPPTVYLFAACTPPYVPAVADLVAAAPGSRDIGKVFTSVNGNLSPGNEYIIILQAQLSSAVHLFPVKSVR